MHAINGTVGDPNFEAADTLVLEITLTLRIPKESLVPGVDHNEMAATLGLWLQGEVIDATQGNAEVGVRSAVL